MGPLVVPLVTAGVQLATGAIQRAAAKKRRREALGNMSYDIPPSTQEQVRMAREKASQNGLPGEDITRSKIDSDISNTLAKGESVAQTSQDVLGLYAQMMGKKASVEKDLKIKGAEYKDMQDQNLMKTMGLMADAENQQFYYNRFVPFLSNMGYAGEEAQGGSANIAGGLQTAYQAWLSKWEMDNLGTGSGGGSDFNFGGNAEGGEFLDTIPTNNNQNQEYYG